MLLCFGFSWPINACKAWKARNTKSTSLLFLLLILFGYVCGILAKLTNQAYMSEFSKKWYVLSVYVVNLVSLIINLLVYFRNRMIEKRQ